MLALPLTLVALAAVSGVGGEGDGSNFAASTAAGIEPSNTGEPTLTTGGYDGNGNDPTRSSPRLLLRFRTAVITEPSADLPQLSLFLAMLEAQRHNLTFFSAYDPELRLRDEASGSLIFENAVVIAEGVEEFGGNLSAAELVKFVDLGGNVFLATASRLGDAIADFATNVGFAFDAAGANVLDHAQNLDRDPTLVTTDRIANLPIITGPANPGRTVLFRGIGLNNDRANKLAIEVLVGTKTSYAYRIAAEIEDYPAAVGRSTVLMGVLQTRNNARVLLSGSIDAFRNPLMVDPRGDNAGFAASIAAWTLGHSGRLSVHSTGGARPGRPDDAHRGWFFGESSFDFDSAAIRTVANVYVPGETVVVCADLAEQTATGGLRRYGLSDHLEAKRYDQMFSGAGATVQMRLWLGDRLVHTALASPHGMNSTSTMCSDIQLPDEPGSYTVSLHHTCVGYSNVLSSPRVTVRPRPRPKTNFLGFFDRPAAAPYVWAVGVMAGSTGLFCILFWGLVVHGDDGVNAGPTMDPKKTL